MHKPAMYLALLTSTLLVVAGCSKPATTSKVEEPQGAYRIYVTNETTGDLSILDSARFDVIATIPLGKRPRGIHASPDGKTIYVALSGSPIAGPGVDESKLPPPDKDADGIGVFDVAQNKLVKVVKSGSDPENFDISSDGKYLYVSNEDAAGVSILDIAAGKILQTLPTGEEPEGVTRSPDGKFVYVTSEDQGTVSVVDTAAAKVIKTIKVGRRPRTVVFLPDGSRAFVTNENDGNVAVLDATSHTLLRTFPIGTPGVIKPMSMVLSKDAARLYVSTGRGHQVMTVDAASGEIRSAVEVGQRPWGITLSPDGKTLFTANGPSNDLTVLDVATRGILKKVKLTGSPWGVITLSR